MVDGNPGPVRFVFDRCETHLVVRAVMAAVDHLCSLQEIDVDLLQTLELPVGECLEELERSGVDEVGVEVEPAHLVIVVSVRTPVPRNADLTFGEGDDIVRSFFAVDVSDDRRTLTLRTALS